MSGERSPKPATTRPPRGETSRLVVLWYGVRRLFEAFHAGALGFLSFFFFFFAFQGFFGVFMAFGFCFSLQDEGDLGIWLGPSAEAGDIVGRSQ